MSFGFSVGDFLAAIKVTSDLISCLKDATGSVADYRELISELTLLEKTLQSLDQLRDHTILPLPPSLPSLPPPTANPSVSTANPQPSPVKIDSVKIAVAACRKPLEDFLTKVRKFESTLGGANSINTGVIATNPSLHARTKRMVHKIEWYTKADDISKLRSYLNVHMSTMNTVLLQYGIEIADLNARQAADDRAQLQESIARTESALSNMTWDFSLQTRAVGVIHAAVGKLIAMIDGTVISSLRQIGQWTRSTLYEQTRFLYHFAYPEPLMFMFSSLVPRFLPWCSFFVHHRYI